MNSLTDFLVKLDRLTATGIDRSKLIITTEEGYTVKLNLEVSTVRMKTPYPIQVVIQVIKDGMRVSQWGCDSNESNQEAIFWLYKKGMRAKDLQYDEEERKVKELKVEFDKI